MSLEGPQGDPAPPLRGVAAFWQGRPVWSTLPGGDTLALHQLAQHALVPLLERGGKVG